jgi:preprotein translocase subunit YajC
VGYLIVIVALFAALWLFLIRPQRRRQVEQARMQDALARATRS